MIDRDEAKRRVREILADAIPHAASSRAAPITINGSVTVVVEAGFKGHSKVVLKGRGSGSSPSLFIGPSRARAALEGLPPYRAGRERRD